MSEFRVWAPSASAVDLHLLDPHPLDPEDVGRTTAYPMLRREGGWWSGDRAVGPDAGYWFAVDGGDPVPDPRSGWQPQGVHGASHLIDHSTFEWNDSGWQAPPL